MDHNLSLVLLDPCCMYLGVYKRNIHVMSITVKQPECTITGTSICTHYHRAIQTSHTPDWNCLPVAVVEISESSDVRVAV